MSGNLLIVYHSQTGNTLQMARAVLRGAQELEDVSTRYLDALSAGLEDLLWCDAIIFGTPENFGYMSGALKNFLDRTYYPAQEKVTGKPYAIFVSCGNDGSGAVYNIQRIAKGYPLTQVMEPIVCKGELSEEALSQCFEMGMTLAAGLSLGIY
ncbi:MAG: flavodoxin family protein [Gammaproteobacteria bacterium]|nr:flavodoxin family protein [Gammaproteobacteria bacterium]